MIVRTLSLLLVLGCVAAASAAGNSPADPDPNRFGQEIRTFAEWDSKNAVPADPVLFVGSSTIRLWRTHDSFPELPVINRGFGGSHISDVIYFANRVVLPYRPRLIVFYAGDNDIAAGKSARRVFEDYRRFVERVRARLPAVRILFLGIKPSRSRWSVWPEANKANDLIRDFCNSDPRLVFVDLAPPLLGPDGQPMSDLFRSDQLHLNDQGYTAWNKVLAPVLRRQAALDSTLSPPARPDGGA
jgi:lysophospholipase L1-like esterase